MNGELELPICPYCAHTNQVEDHFCKQCTAPLTPHAATDPLGQIFAQGFVYRSASQKPQKLIVVVGMWILFVPFVLVGLAALIHALATLDQGGLPVLFFCGVYCIGMAYIGVKLLFRTTRNYLSRPIG